MQNRGKRTRPCRCTTSLWVWNQALTKDNSVICDLVKGDPRSMADGAF